MREVSTMEWTEGAGDWVGRKDEEADGYVGKEIGGDEDGRLGVRGTWLAS